jgi:hypothetical protein
VQQTTGHDETHENDRIKGSELQGAGRRRSSRPRALGRRGSLECQLFIDARDGSLASPNGHRSGSVSSETDELKSIAMRQLSSEPLSGISTGVGLNSASIAY